MKWIIDGSPTACIILGCQVGRVEQNGAEMLASEVEMRCGVRLTIFDETNPAVDTYNNWIVLGTPVSHTWVAEQHFDYPVVEDVWQGEQSKDGIIVQTSTLRGHPVVYGSGISERAVYYAVDELLDRLVYEENQVWLPEQSYRHAPSFSMRGTGHIHYGALDLYGNDSPHWGRLERIFRFMARRRGNVVLMDPVWPAGYSNLVDYRYMPEMYEPGREGILEPLRERGRRMIDVAASYGIDTYLTTAEFFHPDSLAERFPELKAVDPGILADHFKTGWAGQIKQHICASSPLTWRWYQAKIREIVEHFPAAAGIELWVSWSDTDIWYCGCDRCCQRTPAEHLLQLVEKTLEAMDLAAPGGNKRLMLRTYLGGWRQILEVPFFAPLKDKLGPRVMVLNKAQYGDMYYGNAPHPLIGQHVPNSSEGVEFCLGGEYRGGIAWGMLAPVTELLTDRMHYYHQLGVPAMFERHLPWRNTFNEADFDVFYALSWDLDTSPEQIWQAWAARQYGVSAGPEVVALLRMGTRVMEKAFYVRGVSFTSHHLFGESLERLRHLTFDRSAASVSGGKTRVTPTPENIRLILEEKDEAVNISERLLVRLEKMEGRIPANDHQTLMSAFRLQHEMALIYRALARVFWPYLQWAATLSEVEREFQRQDLMPKVGEFREAVRRLRQRTPLYWNQALFSGLGTETEMIKTIDFENGFPYAYLDRIADDIERDITVEKASLWGYFPRPADLEEFKL